MRLYFKDWRRFAGLTQQALADQLEVAAATVSRIETGKRDFTGKYLAAFVEIVGCPNIGDPLNRKPDEMSIGWPASKGKPQDMKRLRERAEMLRRLLYDDEPADESPRDSRRRRDPNKKTKPSR